MKNVLLESLEISQEVKNRFDAAAKSVFSLKEIIADLLALIMPEIFGGMKRNEIVEKCLTDPESSESIYITKLDPHRTKEIKREYLYDIIFKVKLPEEWLSKYKNDSEKEYFLQNIEPQSYRNDVYSEEMRVVIYLSNLFINENELIQITENEKEEYKNALPVCSIWIMYNPRKKDRYSTYRYILIKEKEEDGEYIPVDNEREFPVLSAYIINLGPDNHYKRNDIYGMLRTLLTEDKETVNDLLESKKYNIPVKEKLKMTFGEARLHSAFLLGEEKGMLKGEKVGEKIGEKIGEKKGKIKERERLRKEIRKLNQNSISVKELMALLDAVE